MKKAAPIPDPVLELLYSDSYRIQTCNLLIRSQMLYSVELRSRFFLLRCKVKDIFDTVQIFRQFFSKKIAFFGKGAFLA